MSLSRLSSGENPPVSASFQSRLTINGSSWLYAVCVVLLAAVYVGAAKFGLSLASVHTNVSPVWPSTGIAIAAILLFGYRVWPGIFLGAFLVNFMTPVPGAAAFGIAVGNTLEALAAGGALNFFGFRKSMDRARDVFKFVAVAAVCTMISATIGTLSLDLGGAANWSDFGSLWLTWWLGDLTGAVTVAPLLLTWSSGSHHWLPRYRYLEATVLILLLSVSGIVTFGEASPTPLHYYPLSRLMIPFLLWAAFRLGRRGVTVAIAVISSFAIWGTSQGLGPFVSSDANQSLLMLQLFIASNAVTFLFLVTVVEERRLAEARRREDQRRLEANLAVTRILAESPEAGAALDKILPTVGETLGWEFGCFWVPTEDGKALRSIAVWQATPKPQFERVCRERTFDPGIGLPGRVWTTLKPAWIRDVTKDDNFPRAPFASAEGLHAAFAFPIMFRDEFVGVMEFFSLEIRQPDEPLLAMFAGIGSQIGQFIERKQAEAAISEVARQQSAFFEFASRAQHSTTLREIYDAALDTILVAVQCDRASILLSDEQDVMRFVGWRGLSADYRKAVEGHSPWRPDDPNPQPLSISDIQTADLDETLKRVIVGEGVGAAAFIPLVVNGKLIGKFMTYYLQPHEFSPEEINLSLTLARQLATVIDRRRAAEALRENESRLRLATTTGKVGVWDWDIVANRVSWTDSLYEIHGVTKEEFDGTVEAFAALVHPEDRERVAKAIEASLHHNAPYQLEMRIVRSDGEAVWIYTNAIVLSENGKPVRMLGATVDISEIKRTEQALRDSEVRYRSAIDALPAAVYTTDAEGRITMFNQAAVELAGRVPELGSDSWCITWKLFHPNGTPMPHDECPMAVTLKTGEPVRGEEAIAERPDGSRVNFIPYPTPLRDTTGRSVGAINMLVDITERKHAEFLVDSQRQALQLLAEGAPLEEVLQFLIGVVERNSGSGMLAAITLLNDAGTHFQRGIGASLPEVFNAAVEGVDVSSPTGLCAKAVRQRQAVAVDDFNAHPAWQPFGEFVAPYGLRSGWSAPIISSSGQVLGTFANYYRHTGDPTPQNKELLEMVLRTAGIAIERKRVEDELRHFAAIVETTDDAVISKDLNGIIISWNPAAERLYGYKSEEVIGKPVSLLIPPEWPDEEERILGRLRQGERIDHYETIRVAKDGRRLHVSLTVSPIYDARGKIIGASKIARDVTDQKRAQEEIARLLIAERVARQDAEVASRTKDEFLAMLSHELRTPLTAMLGWLTILRTHKLDKKTTQHAVETIERNAKAQAQLIEDLVDISRIVGGKLSLEVSPTELLPVINASIEVVRPAADAKEITIDVNYDATVGPVSGDASRLQQVIWNLLSNAVKFTPKNGTILVDFCRRGEFAEIVVRDTGIGISPDFLPHVFERFRQAESTSTRSHRGMGLGLAIVRHLVELHGGTVTAASDGENRGSTFTIHLPLAAVEKTGAASTKIARRSNGDEGHALKGLRILLVEDEPDARELISMLLQGSGAQVEAVDSASVALERLPLFTPHVLLSDIGLPRVSGYELIRQVRSLSSEINQVPAIALTAFATENDRKMSLSSGFQAHLAKPVEASDLLTTIKFVINGNGK